MPNPSAPAAGSESTARDEVFSTVADAVAELDRRDRERAQERKAAKAAKAAAAADAEADPDDAEDDADEEAARPVKAKDAKADKAEKGKDKKAEQDEDDDAEDEGEDDSTDEKDDAEDQADADDDEGEGDAQDEDKKPEKKAEKPPAKIKLQIDDREVEATPDEVSTYVREAKAEREQVAQVRNQITQQAQFLQQQGQALAQVIQALVGQEPDLALAQSDPGAYIAQQALYRQRAQLLQQVQGHSTQAAQIAQAQQQQAFAQTVERERAALLKAMPELADPVKLSAFQGRIAKVAQRYGLSAQDLSGAFDHRSYLMLRDLGRLADIEEGRANVRSKLKGAPPLKAPEQRAGNGQRNTSDIKTKDAKRAFMKSGRTMRDVRAFLAATER